MQNTCTLNKTRTSKLIQYLFLFFSCTLYIYLLLLSLFEMLNNDSNNNTTTTFDNNQTLTRQRRNKFLSFFPSSKLENNDILKNKWKPTDITTYHNSNRAQQEVCPTSNKSVNTSPTMTSSSSSSSTVCPSPIPTLTKPFFKMTNPCKPDYTMLQKYFSK